MNICIPIIFPGEWEHAAGRLFCFERVFKNNGKPTWIVLVSFRHVGKPPLWSEEG